MKQEIARRIQVELLQISKRKIVLHSESAAHLTSVTPLDKFTRRVRPTLPAAKEKELQRLKLEETILRAISEENRGESKQADAGAIPRVLLKATGHHFEFTKSDLIKRMDIEARTSTEVVKNAQDNFEFARELRKIPFDYLKLEFSGTNEGVIAGNEADIATFSNEGVSAYIERVNVTAFSKLSEERLRLLEERLRHNSEPTVVRVLDARLSEIDKRKADFVNWFLSKGIPIPAGRAEGKEHMLETRLMYPREVYFEWNELTSERWEPFRKYFSEKRCYWRLTGELHPFAHTLEPRKEIAKGEFEKNRAENINTLIRLENELAKMKDTEEIDERTYKQSDLQTNEGRMAYMQLLFFPRLLQREAYKRGIEEIKRNLESLGRNPESEKKLVTQNVKAAAVETDGSVRIDLGRAKQDEIAEYIVARRATGLWSDFEEGIKWVSQHCFSQKTGEIKAKSLRRVVSEVNGRVNLDKQDSKKKVEEFEKKFGIKVE